MLNIISPSNNDRSHYRLCENEECNEYLLLHTSLD